MKHNIIESRQVDVHYLLAECEVRYWEDAEIDGVEDTDGTLTPCREGNLWKPLIELHTGKIVNWKQGVKAKIHFKICDAGTYRLLDEEQKIIQSIDGYVPRMLGGGDYAIMDIDENGIIQKWRPDFSDFLPDND